MNDTFLIEPTETESLEEIDYLAESLLQIYSEIELIKIGSWDRTNNPLKNAPHTLLDITTDNYTLPYPRSIAFP
jgi:glycine dehydrogenase